MRGWSVGGGGAAVEGGRRPGRRAGEAGQRRAGREGRRRQGRRVWGGHGRVSKGRLLVCARVRGREKGGGRVRSEKGRVWSFVFLPPGKFPAHILSTIHPSMPIPTTPQASRLARARTAEAGRDAVLAYFEDARAVDERSRAEDRAAARGVARAATELAEAGADAERAAVAGAVLAARAEAARDAAARIEAEKAAEAAAARAAAGVALDKARRAANPDLRALASRIEAAAVRKGGWVRVHCPFSGSTCFSYAHTFLSYSPGRQGSTGPAAGGGGGWRDCARSRGSRSGGGRSSRRRGGRDRP